MNELASLGLILLFALFAGHLVKFIRVPEVTGYILAGILVGPHVFGWITHENLQTLEIFSEVALGLILFSIGSVFEFSRLRMAGATVAKVTLFESAFAATLVIAGMLVAQQPWQVAVLLGAIAIETAAASTLMVMRECNSAGPFTDTLTSVIAINNILCILAFSVVAAVVEFTTGSAASTASPSVYAALYPVVWQIVGSAALGYLIGLLLAGWSSNVEEKGDADPPDRLRTAHRRHCEYSGIIAARGKPAVGATMTNLTAESRRLFSALGDTDPPLYAIFFVIAGADLNLKLLTTIGTLGAIYVVGRLSGKYAGAWVAGRTANLLPLVRNTIGFALFSQAGLAIGLTLAMHERFPSLAPVVNTVVLSSVVLFEIIGPLAVRVALSRTGETRPQPQVTEPAL